MPTILQVSITLKNGDSSVISSIWISVPSVLTSHTTLLVRFLDILNAVLMKQLSIFLQYLTSMNCRFGESSSSNGKPPLPIFWQFRHSRDFSKGMWYKNILSVILAKLLIFRLSRHGRDEIKVKLSSERCLQPEKRDVICKEWKFWISWRFYRLF